VGGDPVGEVDEALIHGRPSGYATVAWAADGQVIVPIEPGEYSLLVHRGLRWETASAIVGVVAGQTEIVELDLGQPIAHPGWLVGDPHSHASPSGDGETTMEGRLLAQAGAGTQLHFGTDHDNVADYGPLLDALGLTGVMATVISNEVSPTLRGHTNIYPIKPIPGRGNGGAVHWWSEPVETTTEHFQAMRTRHGEDFILQLNHPLDSGTGEFGQWSPGLVGAPDRWSDDFQAVEVNNAGDTEGAALFLDVLARGHQVTPVGVTDSHGPLSGGQGINATFIQLGTDDPAAVTDAMLIEAFNSGRTLATRGPFLDLSIAPGTTLVDAGTLSVEAVSPTWIVVDRISLWMDGAVVAVVEGASAEFELEPTQDAVYVVLAEGDQPMAPVSGETPWAMSGPIRVDVGGDGWTAPLPALQLGG
jgi:hypothetical protein